MSALENLLHHIKNKYPAISPSVLEAFKQTPRHLFIKRSYPMDEMYQDYPLEIYCDEDFISTISQPSFVLLMIDLLKLEKNHKVLEVGAGSGWNAALMSKLCAKVVAIEIIPALAKETRANLSALGFSNVKVIGGDAAFGDPAEAPFDRIIFTAGATDLPKALFYQLKENGVLLFVLKTSSVDLLLVMRKKGEELIEEKRILCSFVPMKGEKRALPSTEYDHLVHARRIKIKLSGENQGRDAVFSET